MSRAERKLLCQPRNGCRRRLGVGHLQKRGDPTFGAGPGGVRKVFLVRQTGLTKVNLIVNHTRQQMQSSRIDDLVDGQLLRRVDIGDLMPFNNDVRTCDFGRQHTLAFLMSVFMPSI